MARAYTYGGGPPRTAACKRGHPWTPENTRWDWDRTVKGTPYRRRTCRACERLRRRKA